MSFWASPNKGIRWRQRKRARNGEIRPIEVAGTHEATEHLAANVSRDQCSAVAPEALRSDARTGTGSEKRTCLPGIQLPQQLEELLCQGTHRFGVSALCLLTMLLVVIGAALGSGVVLETPLWPSPVNSSLVCALLDEERRLRRIIDTLINPLRDLQDERLTKLGNVGPKGVEQQIRDLKGQRESYFRFDALPDPAAQDRFTAKLRTLRALLRPGLVLDNPALGALYQRVARDGGALAVYDDSAVERLLESPKKGGADLEFLTQSVEGQSPTSSFLEASRTSPLVRPTFGCLLLCLKETLAGLLCSTSTQAVKFCHQLLVSRPIQRRCRLETDSTQWMNVLRSWATLIARLVAGQASPSRRLVLSGGASTVLAHYIAKIDQLPSEQVEIKWAPVLAGKVSLQFHVAFAGSSNEISETTMRTAIDLAESLLRESASTARACLTEPETTASEKELDRMEAKIKKLEPAHFRKLRRSYPKQKAAPLRTVLEELVKRGRVRRREDGLIETVPQPNQAASK